MISLNILQYSIAFKIINKQRVTLMQLDVMKRRKCYLSICMYHKAYKSDMTIASVPLPGNATEGWITMRSYNPITSHHTANCVTLIYQRAPVILSRITIGSDREDWIEPQLSVPLWWPRRSNTKRWPPLRHPAPRAYVQVYLRAAL